LSGWLTRPLKSETSHTQFSVVLPQFRLVHGSQLTQLIKQVIMT
jgi:hypothetical protein